MKCIVIITVIYDMYLHGGTQLPLMFMKRRFKPAFQRAGRAPALGQHGPAAMIPTPQKHRHWYHGFLAPNAPLRQAVTAYAGLPLGDKAVSADQVPVTVADQPKADLGKRSSTAYLWATLMVINYEVFPLDCPQWGGELKIVAFLTEADPIQRL